MALDKIAHCLAGWAIAATSSAYFGPKAGLAIGVAIGAVKEIYDYKATKDARKSGKAPEHTADWRDFACTALGALIGAGMFALSLV